MPADLKHSLVIVSFPDHRIIPAVRPDMEVIPVDRYLVGSCRFILAINHESRNKEKACQVELFHYDLFFSLTG